MVLKTELKYLVGIFPTRWLYLTYLLREVCQAGHRKGGLETGLLETLQQGPGEGYQIISTN
jgi:hypothetical protein